jgi:hypothetical protein
MPKDECEIQHNANEGLPGQRGHVCDERQIGRERLNPLQLEISL